MARILFFTLAVLFSLSARAETTCFISQGNWDTQVGEKYGRKDALMYFNPASINDSGTVQRYMHTSELLSAFANLEIIVKTGACKVDHSITRQFHKQVCDCSIEISPDSITELTFHVKYCDTGFGTGEFTPFLAYNASAERATQTLGVARIIGICK